MWVVKLQAKQPEVEIESSNQTHCYSIPPTKQISEQQNTEFPVAISRWPSSKNKYLSELHAEKDR